MEITKEQVLHVAKLARLNLTDEETESLKVDMQNIIAFADKLSELDTADVVPTAHAIPMSNAFRPDEVRPSFDREDILKNAPARNDEAFIVPKVVE